MGKKKREVEEEEEKYKRIIGIRIEFNKIFKASFKLV